ncbi:MAG TPA: SDR family oxidoreductase, partial [Actinopolymorphaceae bacterium]|nr:SDR family oxidoreductase [Actinopolymorphaceae bacterium]
MSDVSRPATAPGSAAHEGRPVAWVTGASRGLGRAIAVGLAEAGYDVASTARTGEALDDVTSSIQALGRETLAVPADVSDPDAVRQAADAVRSRFGRLDACVTAAGISPVRTDAVDISDRRWRQILDVNVDGTFWVLREAGRVMKATGNGGSLVAVSSIHARVAGPLLAAYSASKGAIEALVRTLAVDWAPDRIRVNALAPGYFET